MRKVAKKPLDKRNMLLRGLFMLLMLLVLHVCGTLLVAIAVIQFVVVLTGAAPNARLIAFGSNMGSYLRQIAHFLTYSTEEVPFPFSDWPAD